MEDNRNINWKMNDLIDAILEVLADSEKVVRLLHDLKTKNANKPDLSLILELKINDILFFSTKKVAPEVQSRKLTEFKKQPDPPKEGNPQYIDGKRLTTREIRFEEWCVKRFDESAWLDENRIRL